MNKLVLTSLLAAWWIGVEVHAQADISMATGWYNRANYNPASICKPDYIYLFTNVRRQWLGVSGSPATFNVQASKYIQNISSAFGISMVSDCVGATKSINPMLTYAFRIENQQDWSVSMGLSAGVFSRSVDYSLLEAENVSDTYIYSDIDRILKPDANLGVEFQSTHFIAGLSSTHLLSYVKDTSLFLNTNHRYAYLIYKNTGLELCNYNIGIQVVNRYNLTVLEGNASIRFKHPTGLITGPSEIFDLGLTYRSSHQMICLFGVNITPNLRIGYAYDQSFLTGYSQNTSHEIMLEYRIPSGASTGIKYRGNEDWYY